MIMILWEGILSQLNMAHLKYPIFFIGLKYCGNIFWICTVQFVHGLEFLLTFPRAWLSSFHVIIVPMKSQCLQRKRCATKLKVCNLFNSDQSKVCHGIWQKQLDFESPLSSNTSFCCLKRPSNSTKPLQFEFCRLSPLIGLCTKYCGPISDCPERQSTRKYKTLTLTDTCRDGTSRGSQSVNWALNLSSVSQLHVRAWFLLDSKKRSDLPKRMSLCTLQLKKCWLIIHDYRTCCGCILLSETPAARSGVYLHLLKPHYIDTVGCNLPRFQQKRSIFTPYENSDW